MKTIIAKPNIFPYVKISGLGWAIYFIVANFDNDSSFYFYGALVLTLLPFFLYLSWRLGFIQLKFRSTGIDIKIFTKNHVFSKQSLHRLTYAKIGFGQTPFYIIDNSGIEVGFSSVSLSDDDWDKIQKCFGERVIFQDQLDSHQRL